MHGIYKKMYHEGLAKSVKMKLIENYKQEWDDNVFNSSKCLNNRIVKRELEFEQHFNLLPNDLATAVCHFRTLNHKLPIEYGRFWALKGMTEFANFVF